MSGQPDELCSILECHGGEVLLVLATNEKINEIRGHITSTDKEPNVHQDYFLHIADISNLSMPATWIEAKSLYCDLIEVARSE